MSEEALVLLFSVPIVFVALWLGGGLVGMVLDREARDRGVVVGLMLGFWLGVLYIIAAAAAIIFISNR